MTRSDRMQPIKEIADSRERDAGSVVGFALTVLRERENQLEQLKKYRDEYARGEGANIGSMDGARLMNYRAFVQRLSDAIRQQEQSVKQARDDYERKRDTWSARRVEAKSLDKAIEKMKGQERKVEDRREQHTMDEQSAAQRRSRELADESGQWKINNTGRFKVDV